MRNIPGQIAQAAAKRKTLTEYTDAMRIVNGSGDGMPGITIDRYGTHVAVQVFDPAWFAEEAAITGILKEMFGAVCVIAKDRTASKEADVIPSRVWLKGPTSDIVHEGALSVEIDVNDGLNTGLFLDMRANRRKVGGMSKGKRILNLFSYTCVFGLHAAAAGAVEVTNIDTSKGVLARGKENFERNRLQGKFIQEDSREYLKRLVKRGEKFGGIIIDPPSFARGKAGTFNIKKDLPGLVNEACAVLDSDGFLFAATNYSLLGFKDIDRMIDQAAPGRLRRREKCGQDIDFPGTNISKESYLAAILAY